ncbi:hypothetical protein DET54_114102 [Paenibacillus pabuli]|uniref:Uncharacterized protein n=1 Tax=Paenibacillus pabuli TaxID=1472 RepID=A0ABX9BF10_9BACL|nr:hypothetical protein [Paenibacillus pabuli]RAI89634.1 hypothetical protein DET54_114102 [Paenibacillus pabuli]
MLLLVVFLIILFLLFGTGGLVLGAGLVSLAILAIPLILVLLGIIYIILKIFVMYWDHKEQKAREERNRIYEKNRATGVVTEEMFKKIYEDFRFYHSTLDFPAFNYLSEAQKKTVAIRIKKQYPKGAFPLNAEKYLR